MKNKLLMILFFLVSTISIFAGSNIKQNITVIDFTGWNSKSAALTDKILTNLIQTKRFNVIDRNNLKLMLKENKLQLTGLAENTIEMGRITGVDKLIMGNFIDHSSEYHPNEYYEGKKISDAYYTAKISASIKMLDVESGKYLVASESEAIGRGKQKNIAYSVALNSLANSIFYFFEKQFIIESKIINYNRSIIILDKGSEFGIKQGMDFEIYDKNDQIRANKIAILRITDISYNSSKGRVFKVLLKNKEIKKGYILKESKVKNEIEGIILERGYAKVIINIGSKLGIRKGQLYEVLNKNKSNNLIDPVTGETIEIEAGNFGLIYINKVYENYSKGKILDGVAFIKKGNRIKESKTAGKFNSIKFSFGIIPFSVSENKKVVFSNGSFSYEGKGIGGETEDKSVIGQIVRLSLSEYQPANNINLEFGAKYVSTGAEDLNYYALDVITDYNVPIIPGFIYIYPGFGLGIGMTSGQSNSSKSVNINSDGSKTFTLASDDPSAFLLEGIARIGAKIRLFGFAFNADLTYTLSRVNEWSYTEGEGDDIETIEVDNNLVRYSEFSTAGANLIISAGYEF